MTQWMKKTVGALLMICASLTWYGCMEWTPKTSEKAKKTIVRIVEVFLRPDPRPPDPLDLLRFVAQEWLKVRKDNQTNPSANPNETEDRWKNDHPARELPQSGKLERKGPELLPSINLKPGEPLTAKITYSVVGKLNISEHLCREDLLQMKDKKTDEFKDVKKFEVDDTLPAAGTNENITQFTIPSNAPEGEYRLVSKIYDPNPKYSTDDLKMRTEFPFNVTTNK